MGDLKKVFYAEYFYSNSLDDLNRQMENFCEQRNEEVKDFQLISHSVAIEKGNGTYYEYDEEYKIPDTFIMFLVYSFVIDDYSTYICVNKLDLDSKGSCVARFRAKDKNDAILKAKSHFKFKGYYDIKDSDIICKIESDLTINE